VLVVGGDDGSVYLASAELYDPLARTFTATGSLATARIYQTATLLPSGKVLVAGGINGPTYLPSAELYDSAAGTFSATGGLTTARDQHTATLLPSGKVLVVGGAQNLNSYVASAELYDEGRGALPAWIPRLSGPLPSAPPGSSLTVTGSLFRGVSQASGGATNDSPSNYPLLWLQPVGDGTPAFAPFTVFTATTATYSLPASLTDGPYTGWVIVNGVLSNGQTISIGSIGQPDAGSADGGATDAGTADAASADAGVGADGGGAGDAAGMADAAPGTNIQLEVHCGCGSPAEAAVPGVALLIVWVRTSRSRRATTRTRSSTSAH
jgi:hypothetical protein